MIPSVYLETSVVSYHTAELSRDMVTAARQTVTQEWWTESREQFELFISVLVVEEAQSGNPDKAEKRLALIEDLPILQINDPAEEIAKRLIAEQLVPNSSAEDALPIALATVHGIDFLLTWNFRHINNARMKSRIRSAIEARGYECPVICSPEELGVNDK